MSAAEIIEQIKALPPAEQQAVAEFVESLPSVEQATAQSSIRYADLGRVKAVAEGIFDENGELFRKLAE
jgi:hypothetical protein